MYFLVMDRKKDLQWEKSHFLELFIEKYRIVAILSSKISKKIMAYFLVKYRYCFMKFVWYPTHHEPQILCNYKRELNLNPVHSSVLK